MMSAQTAQTAQPAFDLAGWSQHHLDRVEQALGQWVGKDAPARLGEAMRYAVLDGGKRLLSGKPADDCSVSRGIELLKQASGNDGQHE